MVRSQFSHCHKVPPTQTPPWRKGAGKRGLDHVFHPGLTGKLRAQELCESRDGRPGLPVPNSSYGLCGRKAVLNLKQRQYGLV